jgi:hypothetical protein
VIELLAPDQPRVGLAFDHPGFVVEVRPHDLGVELVRFLAPLPHHTVELAAERLLLAFAESTQPQPHRHRALGRDLVDAMERDLAAAPRGVHGRLAALHDILVERVLHEPEPILALEQPPHVRLVLGGQDAAALAALRLLELERERRQVGPVRDEHAITVRDDHAARPVTLAGAPPRPRVAEPQLRQHVQHRAVGPAIVHRELDQDVVMVGLRVGRVDVEVALRFEHARVGELELRMLAGALLVLGDEAFVWERGLRILVERLQPRGGRQRIEVEVLFLDVLAVIALGAAETEQAFLQERVLAVPQRPRETQPALAVRDAEQPVLAPAVGAAARVVVRQVVPAVAVGRVVLAHGPPLALRQIRTEPLPVALARGALAQPFAFGR